MSSLWQQFVVLIKAGDIRVSEQGYDALADDGLTVDELLASAAAAVAVKEYPEHPKGPTVIVLQQASDGRTVPVIWGVPRGYSRPAVLVTA